MELQRDADLIQFSRGMTQTLFPRKAGGTQADHSSHTFLARSSHGPRLALVFE